MTTDRIPNVREQPYCLAAESSTEAPPEPMSDVVYLVGTPNKDKRRYVNVTKIYGDKGIARCRVLKSFDAEGNCIKDDEGSVLNIRFEQLVKPDIFPKYASSSEVWLSKASMSRKQLKQCIAKVIDGYMATEAVGFSMQDDADKTISGIKTLLNGYIGGFFLTLLLGFIKRKITKVVEERSGKPSPKKTFERKMSDMKRLFSKPKHDDNDSKDNPAANKPAPVKVK